MRQELEKNRLKTREEWIKELQALAFSRMSDVSKWGPGGMEIFNSDDLSEAARASVAKITEHCTTIVSKDGSEITRSKVSIEQHDKLGALMKYGTARGFCMGDGGGGGEQRPLILINTIMVGANTAPEEKHQRPAIEI